MEYRKLISFGKSSFVVSLPKSWVVTNKLKKGDLIYFEEKDQSLIIGSKGDEVTVQKSTIINIDNKTTEHIRREMNAAYIENFREITFKGKELKTRSKQILEDIRHLIALEVLELDSQKIVTKDFLDMDKVSVVELVKKIDIIVRSMFMDCSQCFVEKNAANIELRDYDVNRLSFLAFRTIRFGLRNQSKILKNFDLTSIDLLNFYWTAFHLEAIADEAKRISRTMQLISLPQKKQLEFSNLLQEAQDFYVQTIKAHYQGNIENAFELSNRKTPLITKANKFYETNRNAGKEISYLVDRFRRLVGSIHELDRLTYQH